MTVTPQHRNRIQAEFKLRGLLQNQVAERCDVTAQHLSDVLAGRAALTRRLARDISRATGIKLDIIFPDGD